MDIHNIILEDSNGNVLKVVGPNGESVGPFQLPKTGQVTPIQDGDDGYYQDGNPISPRFVDNGDNTVSDKATGLMWIKRPELIIPDGLRVDNIGQPKGFWVSGGPYTAGDIVTDSVNNSAWVCLISNTHTNITSFLAERTANPTYWSATASVWAQDDGSGNLIPTRMDWSLNGGGTLGAIDYIFGNVGSSIPPLTKSGKSDWKLPNITEMLSIVNYGTVSPAAYTSFFTNTQSYYYWTSTAYAGYPGYFAWVIYSGDGCTYVFNLINTIYVRPVRQY